MIRIFSLLLAFLCFPHVAIFAQTDTITLNIRQAEALFLKQNYDLLAGNYQLDQAKAEIITAKLFDNPELNYENLLYNQETKKFLQTSYAYGQYAASISQLLRLAGKRNKNIKLAQAGARQAELAYFDLMRTLRLELHSTFYNAYFTAQSVKVYQNQIAATAQLLNAYEQQLKAGNVAPKDVIRIKSLLIKLKSEFTSMLNDLEENQKNLKLLCGLSASVPLVLQLPDSTGQPLKAITYQSLIDSAKRYRPDLKLMQTDLDYQKINLQLQKAMAIPDLEISLSYDLKGNYPEKYTGLGIKIPLPLFNRNQGEIKKASIGIQAAENSIQKQDLLVENEVFNSFKIFSRNEALFSEVDPALGKDFDRLIAALLKNLKERNISLIEFLDLFDAYKENTLQLNQLQQNRMNDRATLNYVTGTTIFKSL